jgi:HSP20 family protein
VDVVEHVDRLEIVADVPGIPAESIRVIYARGTLVIAGRKLPQACSQPAAFHLAERRFGRFVRAVALSGEFDAGRAAASLSAGELRIVLPRVADRRGGEIDIEIIGR